MTVVKDEEEEKEDAGQVGEVPCIQLWGEGCCKVCVFWAEGLGFKFRVPTWRVTAQALLKNLSGPA